MRRAAAEALATLTAFVAKNRGAYPVVDEFPLRAVRALEPSEAALSILLELLPLVNRYGGAVDHRGRTSYEGADFGRAAEIVQAIARCPPSRAPVPAVTSLLRASTFSTYFAAPGSPDADKFDRDEAVEYAQDLLAAACVRALSCHPIDDDARSALAAARGHRDENVARSASSRLR